MGKLYIFGIGGTGSRVLRSLTMLLASGVDINASEIVPIIIDPDHAAADLTRTVSLMRKYASIRGKLEFNASTSNKFFKTKINLDIVPNVVMPLVNTENVKFKDYIGFDTMVNGGANQALAAMLFSEKNLHSDMEVGFKGNPNIGSVVLNQFQNSKVFQDVVASFNQGDRIFIISSIFGGTGASGFPLLIKNLRAANGNLSGAAAVKDAAIGAITVLPYFDLKPNEQSEIDSSTFVAKTKAALTYYDRNLTEADVLYYIADNISKQYDNNEGGNLQKNDAHFVELVSALSMVDFMSINNDNIIDPNTNNRFPTKYKEYGFESKGDKSSVCFNDLSVQTKSIIMKPLTQFVLFGKYIREQIQYSLGQVWAKDLIIDDNFRKSDFYSNLETFQQDTFAWLSELGNNVRSFKPINTDISKDDLFSLVVGVKPAKVMSISSNYSLYDAWLCDAVGKLDRNAQKEQRFIELFYKTTARLSEQKLRIQ